LANAYLAMTSQLFTIPDALDNAARQRPDKGYTFISEDGTEQHWSWPRLASRSREIATALVERGMKKGDHVALVLPTADEFIPAFLGVTYGGGVPVPLYPPMGLGQLGGYLDHCKHIVSASHAKILITTNQIKAVIGTVRESAPSLRAMLTFADLDGDEKLYRSPDLKLDDMAFIQFTSGSTSRPKGVLLTHGNLAHNARAIMRDGLNHNDEDVGVSWLPLFHDMGLIGFVIAPIMHPVPVVFMPPLMFLKRPAAWLKAISKHRGSITYAPNFAYAITTKRVKDDEIQGVDLSSVRVAGCGAEPIQADTLRAFVKRFGKYGFKESAYVPSYGMAESTLAIAFSTGIPSERVKSNALWEQGKVELADADDASAIEIVGCGPNFAEHGVKIVNPDTRETLGDRQVGEILIKGPSVTQGYFEDAEKTAETIDSEGWLRTGDLGYLSGGNVFICGRKKDVIIINGKNYYPQDLEWVASRVDGVRTGNVAAFPTFKSGLDREAVVVVAEAKSAEGHDALATSIKNEIQRAVGIVVDDCVIAESGTIPKTSSGKIQRSKARALYEAGELKKKEADGTLGIAKRVLESQFAHLKLSIFGGGKK
jgi:fatty-acyl-CoA synthase